ncbi:amidohydrolase [Pedosphaera parvula]|uniref:Amidohydrolase 3 n=1 Tax=Pedosphaera parvula (strain Ellin514) TaxID=320771 RepID=B9XEV0_PEDPL|nr:amidohydrolase [Pedosphaera parvula]EEF61814.1 Amidohydrolase 3 [Pedosphaera parvula Ellin514]
MKLSNILAVVSLSCAVLGSTVCKANQASETADLIIQNAKVVTVNSKFAVEEAIAVKGDRILAVGKNKEIARYAGPNTRIIEAKGKSVMPGLYDSHVHSYKASVSEFAGTQPNFESIAEALHYIRKQTEEKPPGSWIILERVYPTRLKEGRLPTLVELDKAASNNPVYWNCGPVSMANSKALELSKISSSTTNPPSGEVVKNPKTLKPTGLLRNAAQLLALPAPVKEPTPAEHQEALKHLYHLYNEQGITSIGERRTEPEAIDMFRRLSKSNELTVRINCTRVIELATNIEESILRLDAITNAGPDKLPYGPTGVGDDWVRIGPLKTFMDGGMLIGTAYMRTPWGVGPTYQITEAAYRGILYPNTEILTELYLEAAQRGWQLTAHCAGDAAMDALLNTYQSIQFKTNITQRRFLITHGNFQTAQNWEKCKRLGVAADMQPAWLYKDGDSLLRTLGEKRMENFQPFKTWFDEGIIIGGGSDHMVKLDSIDAANPWNPWLGMWITLARMTESGRVLNPDEKLTREQAIRFYTINNAYLNFEETKKGSLEADKFADLIIVDRDILKCSVNDVRGTKVLMTMVGGKIVFEAKN